MKRNLIVVVILFAARIQVGHALNPAELAENYDKVDQARELSHKVQKFMRIAINDFKYRYCDPVNFDNECVEVARTPEQKASVKARAKIVSAAWRATVDEVDDWVQSQ